MARTCAHAPVPPPAERARALVRRAGSAALVPGADDLLRVVPTLHHVPAGGAATLQLPSDHPLVARARCDGPVAAMLELTDTAPTAVREPVRGLVWISGWVRLLTERTARRAALRIAAEAPDERLLDLGHGAVMLRLDPASVVLADAEGTAALAPAEMAAAVADPVAETADGWLTHLVGTHPGLVAGLARHLPAALRRDATAVVPLAVDRLGIRLRVEGPDADHDVRIAFSQPVTCRHRLGEEVRALATCPPAGEPDRSGGLSPARTPGPPTPPARRHRPAADA